MASSRAYIRKAVRSAVGSACAALLTAAAAAGAPGAGKQPAFDQGVVVAPVLDQVRQDARTASAPSGVERLPLAPDEGSLWVALGQSDLAQPAGANLPLGSPIARNERASVFQVAPDRLGEIARIMHEKFHKCAGFFAFKSRSAAEAALAAPAGSAGGPYTLDQQAVVKPLVARVKEDGIRSTIEALAAYDDRYYTTGTGVQAAQWVAGRWQALADRIPGATVTTFNHSDWKQPSVVATIPGSEHPDEVVVLGGHLDSINVEWGGSGKAPGADDNASGIAVLTETLRVLSEGGFRPKRTVQIMGYAAEEVGLRGSADIADQYKAAGKKVVGVIQFDMTNFAGSGENIYLLTDNVDSSLTEFLGKLVDAYTGVGWSTTECGYACSDHASWMRAGYPASIAFESSFEGMNHNLHTDRDTLGNSGGSAAHSVPFAKLATAFAVELAKSAKTAVLAAKAHQADATR